MVDGGGDSWGANHRPISCGQGGAVNTITASPIPLTPPTPLAPPPPQHLAGVPEDQRRVGDDMAG